MDLVTLTVATDKIELRCNAELTESQRTEAVEKLRRFVRDRPEINQIFVDIEREVDSEAPAPFVTKGQIESGGPGLLASVADRDPLSALDFLVENFDRQLLRRRLSRVRVSLLSPQEASAPAS